MFSTPPIQSMMTKSEYFLWAVTQRYELCCFWNRFAPYKNCFMIQFLGSREDEVSITHCITMGSHPHIIFAIEYGGCTDLTYALRTSKWYFAFVTALELTINWALNARCITNGSWWRVCGLTRRYGCGYRWVHWWIYISYHRRRYSWRSRCL